MRAINAAHRYLYLGEDERDRHWRFQKDGDEFSLGISGRYVANRSELRLDGALHHLGIASLPECTAARALADGQLESVLADWQLMTGTAWLLYPPNRYLAAKLRVWIDHVVAGICNSKSGNTEALARKISVSSFCQPPRGAYQPRQSKCYWSVALIQSALAAIKLEHR